MVAPVGPLDLSPLGVVVPSLKSIYPKDSVHGMVSRVASVCSGRMMEVVGGSGVVGQHNEMEQSIQYHGPYGIEIV